MSTQSTANNPHAAKMSQVPPVRSFEFDKNAIGAVKSSVNNFRGSVALPMDFMTLPGFKGMDVKISAFYSSAVSRQVETWNIDAPTGILGLGWYMSFDYISVDKSGSGASSSDRFYLVSNGTANPLIKSGERGEGIWVFQLRNYEFWDISYDTVNEKWTIIKEDGFVSVFGGETESDELIQWGVKWGNWIGSSAELAGQQQFPVAWNLARVTSPWGHQISYRYQAVKRKVGQGGKEFTQASYLSEVIDSYGREIVFAYKEKYGPSNPGPLGQIEYQAQNAQQPEPNAYQNKYETLYLDHVEINNPQGEKLYQLQFTYDFSNMGATGDPAYPLLWKRYLKSVFQVGEGGATLPSMAFEYCDYSEINKGALKRITYPGGGVANYEYKNNFVFAPKTVTVRKPEPNAVPGVWQGPDYVVFTYCGESSGLDVLVYSWAGQWVSENITAGGMRGIKIDPDSVLVYAKENFISISFRDPDKQRDHLYLFRKDASEFGKWKLYNDQPIQLPLSKPDADVSSFVAGDDFVMAFNKDYTGNAFQGYAYDWRDRQWRSVPLVPSSSEARQATGVAISAIQNYYIVSIYDASKKSATFQVFYRDLAGVWKNPPAWSNGGLDMVVEEGRLLFAWSPQPTGAIATYVTGSNSSVIDYSLRVFQWDENFFVLNAANPKVVDLQSPLVNDKSQYEIFATLLVDSFVNNNPVNLRNVGGDLASGFSANWLQKDFSIQETTSTLKLAAGQDVAVLSEAGGTSRTTLMEFNPNFPDQSGWTSPALLPSDGRRPTVAGNYMTYGNEIYVRDVQGRWNLLPITLYNLGDEDSVQNRGPEYIAYQDGNGSNANSYVVTLNNGQAETPQQLPGPGQKIYVPREEQVLGTGLAGPRFLVSYPSADAFADAATFSLINLDDGKLATYTVDTPVATISIDNQYQQDQSYYQSLFYANSPSSMIAYNSATGVTQYPLVTVVQDVMSTADTPPAVQPIGRTEYYYSNGISPQPGAGYQQGWVYNYAQILNGFLLATKEFDSDNRIVTDEVNYWRVMTDDANLNQKLYGGYVRLEKNSKTVTGVTQESYSGFDVNTGVELWQEVSYFDAEGKEKRLRTEMTYGWQVEAYKSTFLARHIYTSVVRTDKLVYDVADKTKDYIESEVTSFRNWAVDTPSIVCASGQACLLAPYQTFQWLEPGSTPPSFDFGSYEQRPGWLCMNTVKSRTQSTGLVLEQVDQTGVTSSFVYDNNESFILANFPNASAEGGETGYAGFESYETLSDWTLGQQAAVIPNESFPTVDAHTGTGSVMVQPGASAASGISATYTPKRQDIDFVFSAWVKKPASFNADEGDASWLLQVAGDSYVLPFSSVVGEWQYVYRIIQLPAGQPVSVYISCSNSNSAAYVLVDDLVFCPLSCIYSANTYDTRFWVPDSNIGANGTTTRSVFDVFEQPVISTNSADVPGEIINGYFSRMGNQGVFNTADPNANIKMSPSGEGQLCVFTRGDEWQEIWESPADTWRVEKGVLTQRNAGTPGTLQLRSPEFERDYGLSLSFDTREQLSGPLGLAIGTQAIVQWDPASGEWQLFVNGEAEPAQRRTLPLFAFASAPYAGDLNTGRVSDELSRLFLANGYMLSTNFQVTPAVAGSGWSLASPDGQWRYNLTAVGDDVQVNRIAGKWMAFVGTDYLVFWANGQRIFSVRVGAPFQTTPSWFFSDQVAISQLTNGKQPDAQVVFSDSCHVDMQTQAYVDGKKTAVQTFKDTLGRPAVRSKNAFVDLQTSPLFEFFEGFAIFDWSTSILSGWVASRYPEDEGYAYARDVYEASPMGRIVEQGLPGKEFRVGAHSTRFEYSSYTINGASDYFKLTSINANGDIYYEVSNHLEQVLLKVSKNGEDELRNAIIFDNAGNPVEMRSPNYFSPPPSSLPEDWSVTQRFDSAGRLTLSESRKSGAYRYIYDLKGGLRFSQDPEGAAAGTYTYRNYDPLGRVVETGYVRCEWNQAELERLATDDPSWPATPATWKKQYFYDEGDGHAHAIGRVYKSLTNSADLEGGAGTCEEQVTEQYTYDVFGNTTSRAMRLSQWSEAGDNIVAYAYDNVGNITEIVYPHHNNEDPLHLYYRLNSLGQITAIDNSPGLETPFAIFDYHASGQLSGQRLSDQARELCSKSFSYNSPQWLKSVAASRGGADNMFSEILDYTGGGFGGAAYYDGTIAATAYTSSVSGINNSDFAYSFDQAGRVLNGKNSSHGDWDIGVTTPLSYDANGNAVDVAVGGEGRTYQYLAGTQRVSQVVNAGGTVLSRYDYNDNGDVRNLVSGNGAGTARDLSFSYDPATRMTRRVADAVGEGVTLDLTYDSYDERIVKQVSKGGEFQHRKLYVRGTNAFPVYELTQDEQGNLSSAQYIFGPGGMIAMAKGGERYVVVKDHLGSIRQLVNTAGEVAASYDYLTFGGLGAVSEPESGFMSYLYTGQEYDAEIGLYNYRARFYSPDLGRFVAVDPAGQFYSPYLYAANNPVLYIDPTGRFSLKSFFSAIAGVIIGAVEILIGVAIDVVAGILEVVTGGLGTAASIGLASAAGFFYGAGISSISYSVFNFNDFSWKDYGIQMGIGAVAGAISFGFGAAGGILAESATGVKAAAQAGQEISQWAKAGAFVIEKGVTVVGGLVSGAVSGTLNDLAAGKTPGVDIAEGLLWSAASGVASAVIPTPAYKAGWGNLGKRVLANVAKNEVVGVSVNTAKNAVHGDSLDKGVLSSVSSGLMWGSIGGMQTRSATKQATQSTVDAIASIGAF